jgi:hypothetical protein
MLSTASIRSYFLTSPARRNTRSARGGVVMASMLCPVVPEHLSKKNTALVRNAHERRWNLYALILVAVAIAALLSGS